MSKRTVTVSKFMSKYLRHEPETLGLTLEPGGWVLFRIYWKGLRNTAARSPGKNFFTLSRRTTSKAIRLAEENSAECKDERHTVYGWNTSSQPTNRKATFRQRNFDGYPVEPTRFPGAGKIFTLGE